MNGTSGYSHTKHGHSTQITRRNTDHEDDIVSGDTMNVDIPLYAPKPDMDTFIKPSVIVFSHWYDRVQYSTMRCTLRYDTLSLHSAQEYCTGCNTAQYITVKEITVQDTEW